jgi:hypothetical protein
VRVASATQNVPALPARAPVSQIAQATGSEARVTAATAPSRPPATLPGAAPTRLAAVPAETDGRDATSQQDSPV